ncbi:MAG: hypothetical protein HQL71_09620 [Magnetococcales bacterium]|nr:hypothetical protein [Magnetococcales bacterium]
MDENNNNSNGIDELTLEEQQAYVEEEQQAYVEEEQQAYVEDEFAHEEVVNEPIYVPVESLGSGVVSALADMVGGLVVLKGSAEESIKKGVQVVKEKIGKSNSSNSEPVDEIVDDIIEETAQDVVDDTEQVIAIEPTADQAIAIEPTADQAIAVEPTDGQVAQDDEVSKT